MITGMIVVAAAPAVGLLVAAGLVVAGTGLFVRSRVLRRWPATVAGPESGTAGEAAWQAGAGRAILAVAFVTGAIGLCLGGLDWSSWRSARHYHDQIVAQSLLNDLQNALRGEPWGPMMQLLPERWSSDFPNSCHFCKSTWTISMTPFFPMY
jgi:hypothetical protein